MKGCRKGDVMRYCNYCTTVLPEGSRFCSHCGRMQNDETAHGAHISSYNHGPLVDAPTALQLASSNNAIPASDADLTFISRGPTDMNPTLLSRGQLNADPALQIPALSGSASDADRTITDQIDRIPTHALSLSAADGDQTIADSVDRIPTHALALADADRTIADPIDTNPAIPTRPLPDTGVHPALPAQTRDPDTDVHPVLSPEQNDKEKEDDRDDEIVVLPFVPPVEAAPTPAMPVVQGTLPTSMPVVQGTMPSYSAVVRAAIPKTPTALLHITGWVPIISGIVATVIVVTIGAAFLIPASLSITGAKDNAVSSGSVLHLHGDHFIWGGAVSLTLDKGVHLATIDQTYLPGSVEATATAAAKQQPPSSAIATATAVAEHSPTNVSGQQSPESNARATFSPIPVNFLGSFDANILVNVNWTLGKHTIHAQEQFGSRHADISFTVTPSLASLIVSQSLLDFGQVQVGQQVTQVIIVSNDGDNPLSWQAQTLTNSPGWLNLLNTSGVLKVRRAQEAIYVTVDTRGLSLGTYHTVFSVVSSVQSMSITVSMQVVKNASGPRVCANTLTANLGTLPTGQSYVFPVYLSSCGPQTIQWKEQSQLPWLSVTPDHGTLPVSSQVKTLPQLVQLTIDPSKLKDGNYVLTLAYTTKKLPNGSYAITVFFGATNNGVGLGTTGTPGAGATPVASATPGVGSIPNNANPLLSFMFTISASQAPSATIQPVLLNTPLAFNVPGDKNCAYTASKGWTCTVTLSTYQFTQAALSWTATSNGIAGVTFSPASGTLNAGQAMKVTIAIANVICPHDATFSFAGPANIINIPWHCAPIPLTVSTTNINANTDCSYSNGWTCNLTLSVAKDAEGEVQWSQASKGISDISVTPKDGLLLPGQTQSLTLKIPNTRCPASATLSFTSQGANTVSVAWACSEPGIVLSSTNINGNADCVFNNGWSCSDVLTLDSNQPGDPTVSWSASASGINGVMFSPASGQISYQANRQPTAISIFIPDTACPASATLTFAAQDSNSVGVTWSCTEPKITISQSSFNGNTDCVFNDGWNCSVTLGLASHLKGDPTVGWSSSGSGINGITFSPANGLLAPGKTTPVTIHIPNTLCPASAQFVFASQSNTVSAKWGCTEPQIDISANNINGNTDCTYNNGWTCTEGLALTTDNPGDPSVNWSASGNGINGITFSPANGTVPAGQTVKVTITVPPTNCPASASFAFAGQATNTVTAAWQCTPPALSVSTDHINGNTDCVYSNGWSCSETLSVSSKNPGDPPVNWSVSSDNISGVTFSPAHGTLNAGGSVQINIGVPSTNCPAKTNFVFSGGAKQVSTAWDCVPAQISASVSNYSVPDNNCSYSAGSGWTCTESLSVANQGDPVANWTAGSSANGITFSPSSGSVAYKNPATVTITIPDMICPASINFTFSGPANTITVQWQCAAPTLVATPGQTCQAAGCPAAADILSLASGSQGKLNWTANGQQITFSPASGTLTPGQTTTVGVNPASNCTPAATLPYDYVGAGNSTPQETIMCPPPPTPPTLVVTPGGNCPTSDNIHFTCTDTLSLSGTQGNLSWSAVTSNAVAMSFSPSAGTLSSGQQQPVTVTITDQNCSVGSTTYSYVGQNSNTVTVTFTCTPSSPPPPPPPSVTLSSGVFLGNVAYGVSPWVERRNNLLAF
jgi:hypothetical protein